MVTRNFNITINSPGGRAGGAGGVILCMYVCIYVNVALFKSCEDVSVNSMFACFCMFATFFEGFRLRNLSRVQHLELSFHVSSVQLTTHP